MKRPEEKKEKELVVAGKRGLSETVDTDPRKGIRSCRVGRE